MGQSSSKTRNNPRKKVTKLTKKPQDSQILELYYGDKHDEMHSEDITSNEDFSAADVNKLKRCQPDKTDANEKDRNYKYELIKAVSTSAKLHKKTGIKKNYNLSIQTFRGDAVQYLLDVPNSKSFIEEDVQVENNQNKINDNISTKTHCKIHFDAFFAVNKNTINPYGFDGKAQQIKTEPPDALNKEVLDLVTSKKMMKTNNVVNTDLDKKPIGASVCSFCGYFSENDNANNTIKKIDSPIDTSTKKYFYRCPVCQHLIESKSKNKKRLCNGAKPEKLLSLMLDDNDDACKLSTTASSHFSTPTGQFNNTSNLTLNDFGLNDSSGNTFTLSKSLIVDGSRQFTRNVQEKSVMCKLQCSENILQFTVSRDTNLLPSNSVLLLPSQSTQKLPNLKWKSILPKLMNMPTNKVLYVVEVSRSKQKSYNKSDNKVSDATKQMGNTEVLHSRRTKNKYVQVPSKCHNINYKQKNNEDASLKILSTLEKKFNVKLNTLNDFLMQQPKYLISLLINGTLPRQKTDYKPVKIPFDYKKYTKFLSSGV